jgi:hypothetical protein
VKSVRKGWRGRQVGVIYYGCRCVNKGTCYRAQTTDKKMGSKRLVGMQSTAMDRKNGDADKGDNITSRATEGEGRGGVMWEERWVIRGGCG